MDLRNVNWKQESFGCKGVILALFIGLLLLVGTGCGDRASETDSGVQDEGAPEALETAEVTEPTVEPTAVPTIEPTATVVPSFDEGELSLAWSFDSGGPIDHPPLRLGDLLIAAPKEGPLIALDAETGTERWQYDPPGRIWNRAYASDGETIYLGLEGGKLVALDGESGAVEWETDLGINVQVPPHIAGDVLYVPTTYVGPGLESDPEGKAVLFALNAADGSELWRFESDNYILQTPFAEGDTVYAAGVYLDPEPVDEGGHTRLYALDAADGSERWAFESLDGFPKQLYATDTAVAFIAYQDFANGIDVDSGELLWRRDTGNWVPTLSGVDDTIYFGSANTIVHALDANDGSVVWQHNIAEGTFNYILGAPVRAGDELIFLTQQGNIMGLDAADGTLKWEFPSGAGTARTGPTIAGNWIFLGDEDGVLYAYTTKKGDG